jgi:hypothetical protein
MGVFVGVNIFVFDCFAGRVDAAAVWGAVSKGELIGGAAVGLVDFGEVVGRVVVAVVVFCFLVLSEVIGEVGQSFPFVDAVEAFVAGEHEQHTLEV